MKKFIIAVGIMMLATLVQAQNEYDAVRFSQTYQQGTARSAAMGGAFGALGGDLSVTAINPAGMSIYRGAELCLTPIVFNNKVKSTLNERGDEDNMFNFKFANVGFIMGYDRGETTGFTNFAWGITYNMLNDFSANERLGAFNNSSSMLDAWQKRSNDGDFSYFTNELALSANDTIRDSRGDIMNIKNAQLLRWDDVDDRCYSPHDVNWDGDATGKYGEYQSRYVTQKGGIGTWDFAISGAYNNMFFFGASLGVQHVRYKYTSHYHEDDKNNVAPYQYWDFIEKRKVNGNGINLKVGFVVKPINFLRLGAAFHTPTVYSLSEKYGTTIRDQFDNGFYGEAEHKDYEPYDYKLTTPMKGILSAAFIIPGYGLVSFDYEAVNYNKAKFQMDDFDNDDWLTLKNDYIKDKFQKTNNFRLGLEGLAGPVSIRAGYALYGNPYKFVSGNKQRQIFSFGLGFKITADCYIDVTGTYHIYQTDAVLYEWADKMQKYNYDNRYLNVMATFGIRF